MKKLFYSLKSRFKAALFAFFKDEILRAYPQGPMDIRSTTTIQVDDIHFEKLNWEIDFGQEMMNQYAPSSYLIDSAIMKGRKQIFDEVCKWIEVDAEKLLDPYERPRHRLHLSIYIGKKQNTTNGNT